MNTVKINAGATFPQLTVLDKQGQSVTLVSPEHKDDWTMVVVYRGQHCPVCTKYLNRLQDMYPKFAEIDVQIVAVSADSVEQLQAKLADDVSVDFPVYAGLTLKQMQQLGLYVSQPMSQAETDHPFAEPAIFVVNSNHQVQVLEVANSPFVRPDLDTLLSGLSYTRKNDYPIRGTHSI